MNTTSDNGEGVCDDTVDSCNAKS